MTREQIEAFVKKHWLILLVVTAGGIAIAIIVIRRMQSSSGTKATLDTIDTDLKQIDFDINQMDTNLDTFSATQPTEAEPAESAHNHTRPHVKHPPAPIPPEKKKDGSDVHEKEKSDRHKKKHHHHHGKGLGWLVPSYRKAEQVDIPNVQDTGMGLGGYIGNIADPWAVVDSWALVGEEDYRILYDNLFTDHTYGFPGDINNAVRLN